MWDNCIDSWSLPSFLFFQNKIVVCVCVCVCVVCFVFVCLFVFFVVFFFVCFFVVVVFFCFFFCLFFCCCCCCFFLFFFFTIFILQTFLNCRMLLSFKFLTFSDQESERCHLVSLRHIKVGGHTYRYSYNVICFNCAFRLSQGSFTVFISSNFPG